MKKTWILILCIIFAVIIAFLAISLFSGNDSDNTNRRSDISNNDNMSNYSATRTITDIPDSQNTFDFNSHNEEAKDDEKTETELYKYSTTIKPNVKNRVNNIKITCSKINNTIVKSGKEFSFCDIVGKPSSSEGYKPADAFGENGKIIKAIGGGNCQVSTTIYNAALGVKGLKITERHEHNRDVAYIKDGKDATIAYDYLDLKFKNNNDFDIKLYASVNDNKVTIKIYRVQ